MAKLIPAFILALAICPLASAQGIVNGDFSDATGAPWVLEQMFLDSFVTYYTGEAVVTGSSSGSLWSGGMDVITQDFSAPAGELVTLEFDWSYTCLDDPGFDAAVYDVIDVGTGFSVIGLQTLSDTSPDSGSESISFSGTGSYRVILGTWTEDALFDPGVSSFDNVVAIGAFGGTEFVRGDTNFDGVVDITDAVTVLATLFVPGADLLACEDAGDVNDDGVYDVSDGVYLLASLFVPGAPGIAAPVGTCGQDPTEDSLVCEATPVCP